MITEKKGRQCEEMILGNGDKIYFATDLKGREYRMFRTRLVESGVIYVDEKEQKEKYDIGKLMDFSFKAIDVFAILGETKEGVEFMPTLDYFDELGIEDADKLFGYIQSAVRGTVEGDKKKLKKSATPS